MPLTDRQVPVCAAEERLLGPVRRPQHPLRRQRADEHTRATQDDCRHSVAEQSSGEFCRALPRAPGSS
eukprot:2003285-Alexandrium_andersonii.AAC.1